MASAPKGEWQAERDSPTLQAGRPWRTVAVVGGGLAGLAAASALAQHGMQVEIFEAKRNLGGRAGSYRDPVSGETVDHCQHVALGCCTNFLAFCERVGIGRLFRRDCRLQFLAAGLGSSVLEPSWLPAPWHLAPSLLQLKFLALHERLGIARAMLRLAWLRREPQTPRLTMLEWLRQQGQTPRAIERFWNVVLVSALGETLDRVSLAAARHVMVEGFLVHRHAADLYVPRLPLGDLFHNFVGAWLNQYRVAVHCETAVRRIEGTAQQATGLVLARGETVRPDALVVAAPWRRLADLLSAELLDAIPHSRELAGLGSSPISSVHLWLERPFTHLPHAVIVGRLAQWVFAHPNDEAANSKCAAAHYQVVISGSRDILQRPREAIVAEVLDDLAAVWPQVRNFSVRRWRLITNSEAVFSATPDSQRLRLPQRTAIPNLFLAGDWTNTGWPATMEGAVRSGHLAAEALLMAANRPAAVVAPALPRAWWVRQLGIG